MPAPTFLIAGALAATCGLVASGCKSACQNVIKSEETSPDGRYVAGVMEQNCGATTQYADFVAIRGRDQQWADDAAERAVLLVAWQTPIAAFWRKDGTLIVRIKPDVADKVMKRRDSFEGIPIKHVIEAATDPAAAPPPP